MNPIMRLFVLGFAFNGMSMAQSIGAGIKLGGLLTEVISPKTTSGINHAFVVGPSVELRLPVSLSIEGDALYYAGEFDSLRPGASRWQFPVVAKRQFLKGPIRPYIEGGVSFSHITDLKDIPDVIHRSNYGFVLGGGVNFKLLFLRLSAEARYNIWVYKDVVSADSPFDQKRGQALILVGFGF